MRKIVAANPRRGADIEKWALSIVQRFQPEVLSGKTHFDITSFFEFDLEALTGVAHDYRKLPVGIDGFTDSDLMISAVSSDLAEDASSEYYLNSTIGHECGHAIIHVPEFKLKKARIKSITHVETVRLEFHRETEIPLYRNPEWQAHRFSAALLMPEPAIKILLRKTNSVEEVSNFFRVTPAFVKSRMRTLKIRIT